MTSPIGYVIQAQGVPDRNVLLNHLAKVQPTTLTVLDDYPFAIQIKNLLPTCVVVFRDSNFEPAPDYTTPAFTLYLKAHTDKRIVIMVNCEAGYDSARVGMWVRMMDTATALGYSLCVGNWSSGSVKSGQGNDNNDLLTIGEPLLRAFQLHPGHYAGFHEYSMPFAWAVSNGAWGNPNQPPSKLDWTLPQWHIGRSVQGIQNACKALKIAPPLCIVTECLIDTMNDVSSNHDSPFFGMKSDGYKTLSDYWNKVYPGQDHGDILADNQQWAWERAYAPCGFVIGVHTYCWGDASGARQLWGNYRVDNDAQYLKRMEAYAASHPSQQPPPIIAPPVTTPPLPTDASAQRVQLLQQLAANNNQIAENSRENGTLIADNMKIISQLMALK